MKKRLFGILLSFAMVLTMMPALGMSVTVHAGSQLPDANISLNRSEPVKYLDDKGVERTCTEYTVVTSEAPGTWEDGWYVVKENVTLENVTTLDGNIHLILSDGVELTLKKGARGNSNGTFAIYAQSEGPDMGKLTAVNTYDNTSIYGGFITINGGAVSAEGKEFGISAIYDLTINGGYVTTEGKAYGINAARDIKINGGSVNASGTGEIGVGISPGRDRIITINGGKITAAGNSFAIYQTMINAIAGTGWKDVKGTEGQSKIDISEKGQWIPDYRYKKIQFPEVKEPAEVKTKPAARTLTANGSAQELVTAGTAVGGTMQYALGNAAGASGEYSESIPKGTEAGVYYVWYKAAGDDIHFDSDPGCVTVKISEKPDPEPTPAPSPSKKTAKTVLVAKAIASGKTKAKLSWNDAGADRYVIYRGMCGKSIRKYKTVNGRTRTLTVSKLRSGGKYRFCVVAQKKSGKSYRTIAKSGEAHMAAGNVSGSYTNVKDLKVNRKAVSLKKGRSFKIKTGLTKVRKDKSLLGPYHDPSVRFTTSDPGVAVVSSKGKITAKGKGSCRVYVQAVNGIWKTVKVTVK